MIIRRVLIAIGVALIVVPGCGLALRHRDGESIWVVGTVSRTYKYPPHRVAFATLEAMRSDLVESDFAKDKSIALSPYEAPGDAKAAIPREGESQMAGDFPAFWTDMNFGRVPAPRQRTTVLDAATFEGVTKDKDKVVVAVKRRPSGTLVTIHVGGRGNAIVSDTLLNKVADILEHPTYLANSREEGDAMRAFFAGADARKTLPSLDKPDAPELDAEEKEELAKAKAKEKAKKKTA